MKWTPRKASEYKEDFRPRKPVLPPDYGTRRVQGRPRTDLRLPHSRVQFTKPEKVLWPMEGFTKADVIRYYEAVAAAMLPHLKDRPIMMERYPDGIASEYFLQKDAMPQHTPDWLLPYVHEIDAPEVKRTIRYIVPNERDILLYLANYAAITIHPWNARLPTLAYPDYVVFDLDPIEAAFETVQAVALELMAVLEDRILFEEIDLRCAVAAGVVGVLSAIDNVLTVDMQHREQPRKGVVLVIGQNPTP
jgi:hypothetical protein